MGWYQDLFKPTATPTSNTIGNTLAQGAGQARSDIEKYTQQGLGYQQPYSQLGQQGVASIGQLLRDPSSFQADPGYQWRMKEGQKALESSAAARGLGLSGATLKALTRYGQDYGTQEYGNVWNRMQGLANMGQGSANMMSGLASGAGGQIADTSIAAANARAAQMAANQQQASNRQSGLLGLLGGIGGAVIGSVIPGLGTAVGASLGSSLGSYAGSNF